MKSFDTYLQLSKSIFKKFEKTSSSNLDAEDIIAYATLISEFASIVKNSDNLQIVLQETINPETGKIEMGSRISLSLLYKTAAIFSGIIDPNIDKKLVSAHAAAGNSEYNGNMLKTLQDIAKSEHLIKNDISVM